MVERRRIGLVYSYNENWIAGTYYILNIIHALNTVKDENKPVLIILTESIENFNTLKSETGYSYLEYSKFPYQTHYNLLERSINKLSRLMTNKNVINKKPEFPELDFIYPKQINKVSTASKKVNWIPDFQEDHLPHFFSKEEVLRRKNYQSSVVANGDVVVLSSEDSRADFIRLYPNAKAKSFVLPFAVTHPDFEDENIEKLLKKYNLPKAYFFAPNQFWAHKNHIVVFKAVTHLKRKGISITVAMSGKENDHRNKENFKQLKDYIAAHNLETNIKFVGFLPRKEQLCLFKHSIAIIQPSLFEGWSTVVEDAKALGKYLVLSDLKVHKEQIKDRASFFNPNDDIELAHVLEKQINENPKQAQTDYQKNVEDFGAKIIDLIEFTLSH
ncbi:glycosyltransferase family 4 protein [Psychroserpens mesophilus]|uniref:glycosyltransferase family 4 protein n=1 Tax=Psychroserpens mesophilus TaxID=325473 RepID=UPI003D646C5A